MLERALGYAFENKALLRLALTHPSFSAENNQRLEFLGDAVLELVVSQELYNRAVMNEGRMSKLRAELVCEKALSIVAQELRLGKYLTLGAGELNTGGREKPSILSDAMEAVFGAVYLDGGFGAAQAVILRLYSARIDAELTHSDAPDHKSALQELAHHLAAENVRYETFRCDGPPHDTTFYVHVYVGERVLADGKGRSKKAAEQDAAGRAIELLTVGADAERG